MENHLVPTTMLYILPDTSDHNVWQEGSRLLIHIQRGDLDSTLELLDLSGRIITQLRQPVEGVNAIQLSSTLNGIYILRQGSWSKKILIQ